MSEPVVLVVHAVDTEGPLGGDARRLPDGSPEFLDSWSAIEPTLAELMEPAFRSANRDSFGNPYRFNWFILDFTGFRTNPKHRIPVYHDTYDAIVRLPSEPDGVYWHYHAPPASGIGDHWAESWLESNEHNTILARRLLERGTFPAAFRAGGTIEDAPASLWLEEAFLLDFSNRVSERSQPGSDLYHFDWHGAPAIWGSYHPAHDDPRRPGAMRRHVYRSLDLRSRYNEVGVETLERAFVEAREAGGSRVVSFFSHDNRDMRAETVDVARALAEVSERTGVPWRSCTAVEAHRVHHGLDPEQVAVELADDGVGLTIRTDREPFQRTPFTVAELDDGRMVRLYPPRTGDREWRLRLGRREAVRVGVAVTSASGETTVSIVDTA